VKGSFSVVGKVEVRNVDGEKVCWVGFELVRHFLWKGIEVVEGEKNERASDRRSRLSSSRSPSFLLPPSLPPNDHKLTKPTNSTLNLSLLSFFLPSRSTTQMATAALLGIGALVAGLGGRAYFRALANQAGKGGADAWVKGGFQVKMDAKEAKAILGIR